MIVRNAPANIQSSSPHAMDHSFHLPLLEDLKNPLNFLSRPANFRKGGRKQTGKLGLTYFYRVRRRVGICTVGP
jgi:hypothetical protein